jgi:glycosyltransferase involved in cell wall biosynthesis
MVEKIKVKQIFGAHQIYQEIVNFPPEGIEYLGVSGETKKGNYYQSKKMKEGIGRWLQRFHLPRMLPIKPGDYKIIHSSRGIIPIQLLSNKPWVMDIEHVHSFFGLNPRQIRSPFWKRFIEGRLASKNCKAILCHCEATRQAFFHYLDCKKFKGKIRVLYPSSHITALKKTKNRPLRVLTVISDFKGKAGIQTLKIFKRMAKKYPKVEFWIRADIGEDLKKEHSAKNIKFMGYATDILPREELLRKVYSQCDIFFYPTLTDSFGYSLIDAMVAKMPIVATNLFAVPELVQDGKNGLIVEIPGYRLSDGFVQSFPYTQMVGEREEKFISDCCKALEKMIKNRSLRDKMGQAGFERISKGDLSIRVRNDRLMETYKEALK